MVVSVRLVGGEHRLVGDWAALDVANGFLEHLRARAFSPATVRAYAFDVANFARFLTEQRRLPESLDLADVQAFLASLVTHRDRAMVLAMLLGGLRSAEVRGLLLREVDQGRRRLRVVGKGGRERAVPVDAAFFAELGAYLRYERPPGLATAECFVVLRGPSTGDPVTEAGLPSIAVASPACSAGPMDRTFTWSPPGGPVWPGSAGTRPGRVKCCALRSLSQARGGPPAERTSAAVRWLAPCVAVRLPLRGLQAPLGSVG